MYLPFTLSLLKVYRVCVRTLTSGNACHRDKLSYVYAQKLLLNRGVLLTLFHNMMLVCPQMTGDDVDRVVAQFEALSITKVHRTRSEPNTRRPAPHPATPPSTRAAPLPRNTARRSAKSRR
ncbi:hypothetical protein D5R55_30455 [Burkholderia cenocepacia]|uniref:Uncharacterized protein n=1 Tax=Burkholderia cenocepacia TaxID=95486 RepID=A0A3S9NHB0_9BURK|nr:hypothetical protein D5R55_30455 [Burkholderia cenocepacia]